MKIIATAKVLIVDKDGKRIPAKIGTKVNVSDKDGKYLIKAGKAELEKEPKKEEKK